MIYITKWWRYAGIIALADDLVEEHESDPGVLWLADGETVVLPSGYRLEQRYNGNTCADGSFDGEVLPLVVEGEWFRDLGAARGDMVGRFARHLLYLRARMRKAERQALKCLVVEAKRAKVP